jgi:hypothetical protein
MTFRLSEPRRVIVTGWRGATVDHLDRDGSTVRERLYGELVRLVPVLVVHGGDPDRPRRSPPGMDLLAHDLATEWGWPVEAYPARWKELGRSAGPVRNEQMVAAGAVLVLAWPGPGSVGTWDCLRLAARRGIPARVWPLTGLRRAATEAS